MLEGIIIKNISNQYTILVGNNSYICTPRGKFRQMKVSPFVGDKVLIDEQNKIIMEILPRKNSLNRPSVSNVDFALIVTSVTNPSISLTLLDKQISNIMLHKIMPVICLTKLDLLKNEANTINDIINYYEKIGIKVFLNTQIDLLTNYLKDKIVVLTGQSGAGKSSLLNRINPELNLKTNEISYSLNRGKHTTRHCEIFNVNGINFCDTPGFSSLEFTDVELTDLKETFVEFNNYNCKFGDCLHLNETGCLVKEAVNNGEILSTRYDNYVSFIKEIKDNKKY